MRYLIIAIFIAFPASLGAAPRTGLGIILMSPHGFSFNRLLSESNSIDAAMAWDIGDELYLHADYLFKTKPLKQERDAVLTAHYGLGGRLQFFDEKDSEKRRRDDHDDRVGIRAPLGLAVFFPQIPLEVFGEMAGIMDFLDETEFSLSLGIGARYYF